MRPRARGMGIVGTKHHFVYIENAAHHFDSDRVIDETDPDLTVEVLAREQFWEGNWSVAGESAAISRALVPDVEALHHARHPGKAGFGHYDLETRMAVEHAGEDKARHRFQKLNPWRLLRKAGRHRNHKIRRIGIALDEARLLYQDSEVKTDRDADFLSQRPEGLPSAVVDGRVRAGGENVDMAQPAALREASKLVTGKLRILYRELGDADQALRLRRAEVDQPVVISFVANPSQLRVRDRHRIGGTIHDGSIGAVAVHVGQAQLGGGRTQLAFAHHAATFDRPHGAATLCGCVVTMRAKGLAFPGPERSL